MGRPSRHKTGTGSADPLTRRVKSDLRWIGGCRRLPIEDGVIGDRRFGANLYGEAKPDANQRPYLITAKGPLRCEPRCTRKPTIHRLPNRYYAVVTYTLCHQCDVLKFTGHCGQHPCCEHKVSWVDVLLYLLSHLQSVINIFFFFYVSPA